MMRDEIIRTITTTVAEASEQKETATTWVQPLVGFADTSDPLFDKFWFLP